MKLHLPKKLFAALMACMATFSGLSTTIGTGFIAGGAMTIAFVAQEAGAYVNTTYDYPVVETLTGGATVTPTENTYYTVTDTTKHYTISQNGDNKYHVKISGQAGNETYLDSVATESLLIQSGRWRIEEANALTNAGHIYMGGGQIQFGVNQELSNDFTIGQTNMYADASTLSHSAFRVGDNAGQISVTLTGNLTVQENARISYQNSGKLYITGALSGSGNIELDRYDGTGVFSISGAEKTYTGTITGHANVNTVLAANMSGATLDTKGSLSLGAAAVTIKALKGNGTLMLSEVANATLHIANAEGVFSGVISENVTLQVVGGTQTLNGATLGSTVQVGTGAALTLSGTITLADSLLVESTSAGNGFASVSATVASGTGTVDAANAVWYAQGGKKQGTLTNGVVTFASSIYDIKNDDSVVSNTDEATDGATGFNITGSGSTLTLKNVGAPEDLPAGVVINVGDARTATVVISEGCDWTAAEADTILDKQSGSYELTVKDGAKLSFTEYKDLGTNVINVADRGVLQLSGYSGWGDAHFRGDINVGGDGTLILSGQDSSGWSSGNSVKNINIVGSAASGEKPAKVAVVQVSGKQTLVTNIKLSGNSHIQDIGGGQFEFFGGKISASGTNNIIDTTIKTCRTGEFAVDENASLTLNGDIIQGQAHSSTYIINKTGKGELQLKGNSAVHAAFNLQEGSLALLNDMTIEQSGSLVASSGTSLQLGATILNKGTIDISASTLSLVPSSNFAKVEGKGGTESWSLNGTDGFVITSGAEYYLIKADGGTITGEMPTTISGYSITYADDNATFVANDVKGNIFHVNTQDITLTADDVAHAVGYVVADGKTATVAGAKGNITSVSLGAKSTLNIGAAENETLSINDTFTASGTGYLNITGGDVTLNTSISGDNANVELGVTGGSLTISSCNAKITKTTVAADSTLILNASYSNSSASIAGEATVYGTMVFATGDVTGWDGNSGCLTNINLGDAETAGGVLQIDTEFANGQNQTMGKTVINMYGGTIVGKSTSTLDLFNGKSAINVYSVNGTAEAPTESTINVGLLGVRQDNTKITVDENARLTINAVIDDGSANNSEGNNALYKLGAGELVLTKANTHTGGTVLTEGKLVLKGAEASLSSGVKFNGGTLVYDGSTADVSAASGIADGYTGLVKVEVVDDTTTEAVESVTWTKNAVNAANGGVDAILAKGLVKSGSGTFEVDWKYNANSVFAGSVSVTGGKLVYDSHGSYITMSGAINVAQDSTFHFISDAFSSQNKTVWCTISGGMTGQGVIKIGKTDGKNGGYLISGDNSGFEGTLELLGHRSDSADKNNYVVFAGGAAMGGSGSTLLLNNRDIQIGEESGEHTIASTIQVADGTTSQMDGFGTGSYTFTGALKGGTGSVLTILPWNESNYSTRFSCDISGFKGTLRTNHAETKVLLGGEGVVNAGGDIVATLGGSGTFKTMYSGEVNFTGKLVDTAKLVKDGTGTLVLTNGHTTKGQFTVADGTLKWVSNGTDAALYSGTAAIKLEAANETATPTVEFAFDRNWKMAKTISGSGTIVQNSQYKLGLSNIDAAWTGTIDVRQGTLGFAADDAYSGSFTAGANRTVKLAQGAGLTGSLTMSGGTLDLDVRNLGTGDTNAAASLGGKALTLSMGADGAPLSTLNLTMLGTEVVGDTITLLSGVDSLTGITVTDNKVDLLSNLFNVGTVTIAGTDGTSAAADMTDAEELLKSRLEDSIVYFKDNNLYLTLAASKLDVSPLYWEPSASGDGKWSGSSWATADADPGTTSDPGSLVDPWPTGKAAPDVYFTGDGAADAPAKVTVDTDAVVSDMIVANGHYTFAQDTVVVDDGNGGTKTELVGSLSIQDKLSIGKDGAATFDMEATVKDIELTDSTASLTVNKALEITGKVTATSGGTITNGMTGDEDVLGLAGATLGGTATKNGAVTEVTALKLSGLIGLQNVTLTGQIDDTDAELWMTGKTTIDENALGALKSEELVSYHHADNTVNTEESNGYTATSFKAALFTTGEALRHASMGHQFQFTDGSLVTLSYIPAEKTWQLAGGTGNEYVAADTTYAVQYDAGREFDRATALVLKGGSIVLNTGLDKSEGSKLTGGIRADKDGTVTISEGVTLDKADLNTNGNTVTLLGGGIYDLAADTTLGTGVGLGADDAATTDVVEGWTGTVTTSAISVSDISALGNANSAVALTGDVVTESLTTGTVGKVTVKSLEAGTLEAAQSEVSIAGATTLKKVSTVGTAAFNGGLTLGTEDGAATLTGEELMLSTLNLANLNSAVEAARLSNDSLNINIDKEVLSALDPGDYRSLVTLWDEDSLASLSFNGESDCTLEEKGAKYFYTIRWEETESVAPLATDDTTAGTNGEGTPGGTVDNVLPPADVVVLTTVQNPNYMKEKYSDMEENALAGADLLDDAFIQYDPQASEPEGDIASII
ncbi:MAG: autotransporter-associated beta strand repeat-containing protein, partial [Akkermansia sp.]|nr:autotransporter-associated beta strand repeat-containing protein [Akkermansia sp.]